MSGQQHFNQAQQQASHAYAQQQAQQQIINTFSTLAFAKSYQIRHLFWLIDGKPSFLFVFFAVPMLF